MMGGYGRGHPHSGGAESAKASKETRLDTGPDGGAIRAGQKLFGRCGAREKKYLHRQLGNHRKGLRAYAFQTFDEGLVFSLICWEHDAGAPQTGPSGSVFSLGKGAEARES